MTRYEFLIDVRNALGTSPELESDLQRYAAPPVTLRRTKSKSRNPFLVFGICLSLALVITMLVSTDTEARRRVRVVETCTPDDRYPHLCQPFAGNISVFGSPYSVFEPLAPRLPRKWKQGARKVIKPAVAKKVAPSGTIAAYQEKIYAEAKGVSLRGVVKRLANKAREISSRCGSTVTSAVRRGAMVCGGYGCSTSNHALGKAVDMQGNYRCMYALLKNWPGGVSTDPGRVKHVHISYNPGGKEWGLRFAHNGYSTRRTRLARYRG